MKMSVCKMLESDLCVSFSSFDCHHVQFGGVTHGWISIYTHPCQLIKTITPVTHSHHEVINTRMTNYQSLIIALSSQRSLREPCRR